MFVEIKEFVDDIQHALIVDTEFLEIVSVPAEDDDTTDGGELFVDVYKKRGLNVAANLALLIQYVVSKGECSSLKEAADEILGLQAHQLYKDEVMKYLMLA